MSSYFDDMDAALRGMFQVVDPEKEPDEFWSSYHVLWENKLIEDCLGACRAKKFPLELRGKIRFTIFKRRVFRTSADPRIYNEREATTLLRMRHSFLSAELHSTFHDVARYGQEHKIRHLSDSPAWMRKRAPK